MSEAEQASLECRLREAQSLIDSLPESNVVVTLRWLKGWCEALRTMVVNKEKELATVRAEERERCAKIAEDIDREYGWDGYAAQVAIAIREGSP